MTAKEEGQFIGHFECINPKCSSSDGMAVYENSQGFNASCFSCDKFQSHNNLAESWLGGELGIEPHKTKKFRPDSTKSNVVKMKPKKKISKSLSPEDLKKVRDNSSLAGDNYRGLLDKWNTAYQVRTGYDGLRKVAKRYYPVTKGKEDGKPKLVGYKVRTVADKGFMAIGENGKDCDFFGQFGCVSGGKYILLCGGEEDAVAAKQMIERYQVLKGKDKFARIDVIASSVGEGVAAGQAKHHYEFLDSYENIIVNMDDDEAGGKALDKLLEVLPLNKVKVLSMPENCKDACDALKIDKYKDYVSAVYNASKPKLSGIVSSKDLHDRILEIAGAECIPLPPFFKQLEDMLCGGFPVEEIINILASSGQGKSTFINAMVYFWIFHSPYKVGVLSLEAGAGKYGEKLLSTHLKKNLGAMTDKEEKVNYLSSSDVKEKAMDMYVDQDGEERFALVDDRGEMGDLESVKKILTQLIRGCGCKVLIIDPIQDLTQSLPIEEQADFCSWQKNIKSQYGVTFININHARKSQGGQKANSRGQELNEEDMQGTSSLFKSAAVNIILTRDKMAEDEVEKNTTKVTLSKNRDGAVTGKAGEIYYDFKTHTMHEKKQWLAENYG